MCLQRIHALHETLSSVRVPAAEFMRERPSIAPALSRGSFMAINSNLRYQVVNGFEENVLVSGSRCVRCVAVVHLRVCEGARSCARVQPRPAPRACVSLGVRI